MIDSKNYIGALLLAVPEFDAVYQEHIKFYGQRLDHPLFGELFRFMTAAYDRSDIDLVVRIVEFINQAAESKDKSLLEMLQLSFIQYLPNAEILALLKPMLNPQASQMLMLYLGEKSPH